MISILWWIVFGFVVGLIARALLPGRQNMTFFMTVLLGVIGSLVGGMVSWLIQGLPAGGFSAAGMVLSVIGAIVALVIYARVA